MNCTADMLLAFVSDKTASGMARSNKEDRLHIRSAPRFNMGQNCLWDSEELTTIWEELQTVLGTRRSYKAKFNKKHYLWSRYLADPGKAKGCSSNIMSQQHSESVTQLFRY